MAAATWEPVGESACIGLRGLAASMYGAALLELFENAGGEYACCAAGE